MWFIIYSCWRDESAQRFYSLVIKLKNWVIISTGEKWTNFNPKSFLRRHPISKKRMGYRGMSFVTSSGPISFEGVHRIIERIPYESIIYWWYNCYGIWLH